MFCAFLLYITAYDDVYCFSCISIYWKYLIGLIADADGQFVLMEPPASLHSVKVVSDYFRSVVFCLVDQASSSHIHTAGWRWRRGRFCCTRTWLFETHGGTWGPHCNFTEYCWGGKCRWGSVSLHHESRQCKNIPAATFFLTFNICKRLIQRCGMALSL